MFRFIYLAPMMVLIVSPVIAQQNSAPRPEGEQERSRIGEVEIPLPMVSPRAVPPGTLQPLAARQKAILAVHNTFYPRAVANRLLVAGVTHWWKDPEEWPSGSDGFAMRFGYLMGTLGTRNAIQLAADVAFRTEPR